MLVGRRVRTHTGRRWAAIALVAFGVVAGCGSSSVDRVAIVGDSLTANEEPYLGSALAPGYTPTFIVRNGGQIAGMSSLLQNYIDADGTPGVAVADLGTMDALAVTASTAPTSSGSALLQPLLAATSSIPCVVLTTVDLRADVVRGDEVAAQINHRIVGLERSDPTKYKVVDWNEFVSTLPGPSVATYLEPGGIEETASGAMWLSRVDYAAVRECGTTHQPTVIGSNPG